MEPTTANPVLAALAPLLGAWTVEIVVPGDPLSAFFDTAAFE